VQDPGCALSREMDERDNVSREGRNRTTSTTCRSSSCRTAHRRLKGCWQKASSAPRFLGEIPEKMGHTDNTLSRNCGRVPSSLFIFFFLLPPVVLSIWSAFIRETRKRLNFRQLPRRPVSSEYLLLGYYSGVAPFAADFSQNIGARARFCQHLLSLRRCAVLHDEAGM